MIDDRKIFWKGFIKKKKRSILKRILIFFIILEIAGFLTAVGFFIAAIVAGIDGFDLASTGGAIFFAVIGSSMALMFISVIVSSMRRRSASSSDSITNKFRYENKYYTTENYPADVQEKKKKVYYCSYCGHGTR